MQSLIRGLSERFTPSRSSSDQKHLDSGNALKDAAANHDPAAFTSVKTDSALFLPTDPTTDGEECLHDCSSCSVKLPRKWSIDTEDSLYGHVNEWETHLIVATGKCDWVKDVCDEKGSVMEAVGKADAPTNGVRCSRRLSLVFERKCVLTYIADIDQKMMLSASNMPMPEHATSHAQGTTVLVLPAMKFIDNVTPASVPSLLKECISVAPTNTTPLTQQDTPSLESRLPNSLTLRDCRHDYLILLCSQATRDARCGQSAPLLRKEFERHLRPLGLQRDLDDHRPGGAAIYFISHVGGHKYSANVMIYRRHKDSDQAAQCIWLARVRPEDCENIVRYTILQGKVVKPGTQLRGGFDRVKQLISW